MPGMGQGYSVTSSMASLAANSTKTALSIVAPSSGLWELAELTITQKGSTASQQQGVGIQRASAGGTGSTITAEKKSTTSPASGATVKGTMTVEPTYTGIPMRQDDFNSLIGYDRYWPEGDGPKLRGGASAEILGIFVNNPTGNAAIVFEVTAAWREL